MSDKIGPLAWGKREEHIFLGKEMAQRRDFSEQTAMEIDSEIKAVVSGNYARAKQIVSENIETLHALANLLLEKETVSGEEIDDVVFKGTVPPGVKTARDDKADTAPGTA